MQFEKQTIAFNKDGICSACEYASVKLKPIGSKERSFLFELLEPYRSNDGSYDVLVPVVAEKIVLSKHIF